MFRRLFAIETAALRAHADDEAARQDHSDVPPHEQLRDLARYAATPSRYGMWSSRATI